jgi:hypothetical protein
MIAQSSCPSSTLIRKSVSDHYFDCAAAVAVRPNPATMETIAIEATLTFIWARPWPDYG